jgi:hypothetical protein
MVKVMVETLTRPAALGVLDADSVVSGGVSSSQPSPVTMGGRPGSGLGMVVWVSSVHPGLAPAALEVSGTSAPATSAARPSRAARRWLVFKVPPQGVAAR